MGRPWTDRPTFFQTGAAKEGSSCWGIDGTSFDGYQRRANWRGEPKDEEVEDCSDCSIVTG